ncbi:hypothetical protein [Neisseria leonii]|uniref:hypothetical protein n=1 Tax=Neisseria leonii TaxID=2995413 RepID=UPI00237B8D93|nr:hypothetical protein [Neisseria sp. 3986]MDD9326088.1 hypothetical protein [Neisseria sp. 3986]
MVGTAAVVQPSGGCGAVGGRMRDQAGFGLIDVLLAAALGALLVAAAASTYTTAARLNRAAAAVLQYRQPLHDLWRQLADDVRQAGSFGCFYAEPQWAAENGFSDGITDLSGNVLQLAYGSGSARFDGQNWQTSAADGSALAEGGEWLAADCAGLRSEPAPQWQNRTGGLERTAAAPPGTQADGKTLLLRRNRIVYGLGSDGLYRWQNEGGARLILPGVKSWRWQAGYPLCENGRVTGWRQTAEQAGAAAWLLFEVRLDKGDGEMQTHGGTVAVRGGGRCAA